ncbi:DivIVA domain-containing protein [Thermodesulfovibrio thiophilus]|uniref:DivIVA domain-containing protein n=1 Tax=Thermodesulfovibrio thiophilus TaxID=340095 RepID=UPI00041FCDD5|nr:DivIVA domain-containing protein [Thermodesulfovibrio thiophilus]
MRITPLDIQQKQFKIKFRGFDMDEVYSFLEIIREELEEILKENSMLKEKVVILENQLEDYKKIEQSIRDTLMTAQRLVEDYQINAKKEAELIIKEAQLTAENIIKEAQEKVVKIHEDIVDLKGIRRHFKEEIRRLIESHLKMLEFDKEREGEESEV